MPHRPQAPATSRALVWFKRDLRQDDHAPLAAAQHFESALGLFIIEPEWLASPEFSTAQLSKSCDSTSARCDHRESAVSVAKANHCSRLSALGNFWLSS
jgi:deoxyribodipyrimidine photolyase